MTPEQIEAEIRAAFPDPPGFPVRLNGQQDHLIGVAYEARLSEMVAARVAQQDDDAAQLAWEQMVNQFVSGLSTLRSDRTVVQNAIATNTSLTQAQIKKGLDDILTALIWLGERIGDGTIPTRRP